MQEAKHWHHIIPKHAGGTDDDDNLILLTIPEHAQAHLKLYQEHGRPQDLHAYYLLSRDPRMYTEMYRHYGNINRDSGHMRRISLAIPPEQRTINGKKAAETCRRRKVNAFFDPKLKAKIAALGGKAQGENNAKSGHLKKISENYWND